MNNTKLRVRGNLSPFLHTGFLVMVILWLLVAVGIYFISGGVAEQIGMQEVVAGLFLLIVSIPAVLVVIQTITIDNQFITYSSNYFPLMKSKIPIMEIYRISFNKRFAPSFNPKGISKYNPEKIEGRVVGLEFYNIKNEIIGGINTKVYKESDLGLVVDKLLETNPNIKGGGELRSAKKVEYFSTPQY